MDTISAVVTTGIYCRPGCSARPRSENVRTFQLAAAAEAAGYRSCLRCRPYRWPQSVNWAAPDLVCRAVRLILDGALDTGTEAELGTRLGISARHLRRLFTAHLGVTPDGLARSARAHFARRLLDDTDLTVTEIAYAAGFGSLRQFNRACRDVFRESPRMLRARRRKSDRLVADGGLLLRLSHRGGPLDWESMLAYFAARAIPGVEHVSGHAYRRTVVIGGDPGVLELYPGGDDHLLLLAHLPHWEELLHLVQRARRIAGLDFELGEPTRHLGDDPTIGPLLRDRPGLRPPGTWDAFETGVRAIIGQQVTLPGANTIARRLVERLGTRVPGLEPLGLTHTFPPPATLAASDLAGLGLTQARADAIRAFARAVAADEVPLDRSVSLDRLVSSLTALKGLGSWTAHYIALRLGEPDAYPSTDLALQRALPRPAPTTAATRSELAERWRPWRALAATHLWFAGDAQPALRTSRGAARPARTRSCPDSASRRIHASAYRPRAPPLTCERRWPRGRRLIMKRLITGSALATALLLTGSVQGAPHTGTAGYQVTNLASLGGTSGAGSSINNRGWVAGSSNLPGDQMQHAALWRNGSVVDLGTLGGPNSGVLWPVKNDRGIVAGISQTAQPDPLGERWSCSAFFPAATAVGHQCLGFVWHDGAMRPLPTLGGTNGFATGANNGGEIVGWAESTVHDATCVAPQVLQFRAVVWGPAPGEIRELPPLPGDTVSAATALNDRGQVVGISGICDRAVGRFSAIHAVLWQDGRPIDLGSLGGVAWNTPMSINERGDVVGFANASAAAGGSFAAHAFLWTRDGGMHDLGTLPGDTTSQALGVNDRRDVVGTSCDADFNCRAVIWRDGEIADLNALIAPGYEDTLTTANDIDESGRITGQAFQQAEGALVAFVARP